MEWIRRFVSRMNMNELDIGYEYLTIKYDNMEKHFPCLI